MRACHIVYTLVHADFNVGPGNPGQSAESAKNVLDTHVWCTLIIITFRENRDQPLLVVIEAQ